MSGRSRIHIYGNSDTGPVFPRAGGGARAISVDVTFAVPYNCTVVQFAYVFTEPVATSQDFEFGKLSAIGIGYEIIFRAVDPVTTGYLSFICNEHFEVLKGETFFIRYPNTDNVIVGYEAVLTEVF
jgi:hypothetical protein